MPGLKEDVKWFKDQFGAKIQAGVRGTPFSVDMLTAIATQETRYIWGRLYKKLPLDEVLRLCASDVIDAPGRSAFPKNKADLLRAPRGDEMFTIAREALKALAVHLPEFRPYAKDSSPNKFCRGYGIFQYDLQFYKENSDFFLQKRWGDFDECLRLSVQELRDALERAYGSGKSTLSDEEMVYVAIAYNRGSVNFARKFKQGHKDQASGKYYGEYIWEYLQLSKTIA
jgi:hypothetical protein